MFTLPNNVNLNKMELPVNTSAFEVDDRLLVPRVDHSYKLRLLHFLDSESTRKIPFVINFNHVFYRKLENGTFKSEFVQCPQTPRYKIDDAEEKCPFCLAVNALSSLSIKTKEKEFNAIVYRLKYKYSSHMPVIVLNSTENPDDKFKIKVLTLNNKFTTDRIIEIIRKNPSLNYYNNLENLDCFDLNLDVTHNGKYRVIDFHFSKAEQRLAAEWNEEKQLDFFNNKLKPLNFDSDFYPDYNAIKLNELYSEFGIPLVNNAKKMAKVKTSEPQIEDDDDIPDAPKKNPNKDIDKVELDNIVEESQEEPPKEEHKKETSKTLFEDDNEDDFIDNILSDVE